eukprot:5841387-Ditylum_brightwellii.AAC.1
MRCSLLNANYDTHKKGVTKQMQDQAENPTVVLDIVDCTKHLKNGQKKTGNASNMQSGGEVLLI